MRAKQLENQLATKYAVAQPPATYDSLIGLDLTAAMSGKRTTADIRIPLPSATPRLSTVSG